VAGNIIGLNTDGALAMGNQDNGVEVGGNATNIVIGGPQPTFNIIPQNTISANFGNGVAIVGTAHDIHVSHSYIGTDVFGEDALGNAKAGVLLDAGTYSNTVGSPDSTLLTVVSGNLGNGVELRYTHDNEIMGSHIGTNAGGTLPLGNSGNGIAMVGSYDNVIGVPSVFISQRLFMSSSIENESSSVGIPNQIAFNGDNGVFVESGSSNGVSANSIHGNTSLGIDLAPGANMNLQPPLLTSAHWATSSVQVSGTLNAWANSEFIVQFFANELDEPSGDAFLGSLRVFTDAAGFATFDFDSSLAPVAAQFVTATATDPLDNTSEFSLPIS
jgi:hypothetical protein